MLACVVQRRTKRKKNRNFPILSSLHGHSSVDLTVYEVHLNAPRGANSDTDSRGSQVEGRRDAAVNNAKMQQRLSA